MKEDGQREVHNEVDRNLIEQCLRFCHPNGDVFEICGIGTDRYGKAVSGGFFNDHKKAVEAVTSLTREHHAVYATLNPLNAALLARADKRIKRALTRTKDKDVLCIHRLLVDVDPVRPSGVSSTDAEHAATLALCERVQSNLSDDGWPQPMGCNPIMQP